MVEGLACSLKQNAKNGRFACGFAGRNLYIAYTCYLMGKYKMNKQQIKFKLKKGDEVVVLTGRSKGTTGKIESVDRKAKKVIVTGANIYKKHQKPDVANPEGGIVELTVPLDFSNVALVDPKTKKATKVGYKTEGDKKVRFAKASGTVLS